jgi:AhpD family alkylhydroperoxidase
MQPRMNNPAMVVPDVLHPLIAAGNAVMAAAVKNGVPAKTIHLAHLRASQINGCGFCVDMHSREAKKDGDTEQRINAVAAWRDAPWFSDAERAALALAEAATRLSDRADPVPDELWAEATRHYKEPALAALIMAIAVVNLWNRVNAPTRQLAGGWPG